ncbi:hypothetical protein QA612_19900 [Evansella sp. AB-P1]|uniref:hypothetical protein n=1 Tax=Evansella sp. AB-P1 TaxID=3037653 RepID=UPI00241D8D4B|nr:hypothetical protein [Evansella sp. AB-P1]MDG5789725.1 hypothetical protein [Evansella sp. AB-P1]
MYYFHPYPQEDWSSVLQLLTQSMQGEEMVCSMSSQLYHIPATENLEGLDQMHEQLYESSYHRVTALGSAKRLQSGESHETIVKTMVSCVDNALLADHEVTRWLPVMKGNAPVEFKEFIQSLISWQEQTVQSLTKAQQQLRQMGFTSNN